MSISNLLKTLALFFGSQFLLSICGIYIYDRENSNWNFVPDVVGNIIRIKPHEYHCIPKVYGERYSMVFVRRLDFVSQFQKCER